MQFSMGWMILGIVAMSVTYLMVGLQYLYDAFLEFFQGQQVVISVYL
jgi:hypothetical protein